jgi:hypothetical protein
VCHLLLAFPPGIKASWARHTHVYQNHVGAQMVIDGQ